MSSTKREAHSKLFESFFPARTTGQKATDQYGLVCCYWELLGIWSSLFAHNQLRRVGCGGKI